MTNSKKYTYNKKNITPQTRLMDLVKTKFHRELKVMIDELRRKTTLKDDTAWWQVKKLQFTQPKSMGNYEPIARFIMLATQEGNEGLNCSITTFIWYITAKEHSNLNMKYKSAKSLIYSMIKFYEEKENGIF